MHIHFLYRNTKNETENYCNIECLWIYLFSIDGGFSDFQGGAEGATK